MPRQAQHPIEAQFIDRWSPRAFTDEALPEAALLRFIEAARWAPSASNIQPWRMVYGLKGTQGFNDILAGLVEFNQGWADGAAGLVVVCSSETSQAPGSDKAKPNPWHAFDAGAAWMSLALQAHADGWATHGMGGFDAALLREKLGIPAGVAVHCVVAIGRTGDPARLPEALRAREQPSDRHPQSGWAFDQRYRAG